MDKNKLGRKLLGINFYIFSVLALVCLSFIYFYYQRIKNQEQIYVSMMLVNSKASNAIPNWFAEAIKSGDSETVYSRGKIAEVIDKEDYEAGSNIKNVFLLLRLKADKDKTGTYIYKNKPLLVGGITGIKLSKIQVEGLVTYIGRTPPSYKKEILRVKLKARELDPWVFENIKIGDKIQNSKGEVTAEIVDKKLFPINPVTLRYESGRNSFILGSDPDKRDCELTVNIVAVKSDDYAYYARIQRIKIGDSLHLPFKEADFTGVIISVASAG